MNETNRTPARKRESRSKTASYSFAIKVRAAYLAGQGKAPSQICAETGIANPSKLRGVLRSLGITIAPEVTVPVALPRPAADALGQMADKADMTPEQFATRIITLMVTEEAEMLRNILDPGDVR